MSPSVDAGVSKCSNAVCKLEVQTKEPLVSTIAQPANVIGKYKCKYSLRNATEMETPSSCAGVPERRIRGGYYKQRYIPHRHANRIRSLVRRQLVVHMV